MKKEQYLLKNKRLVIRDPELEIDIEERFNPYLVPEDLEEVQKKGLIVKRDAHGHALRAYFEREGKLHGQYHLYYPAGKVETECYYEKGELHVG